MSPQALSYTAKRHGALLPIISNVAIFAAFVLSGFVIFRLLNHQEQFIASGQANVQGAENKIIAAMKKDAEQQLRSRDQAILDAQKKLQALSVQEQQLRDQSDSAIKAKEQALTADFDARLAREKENLQKQGLSATVEVQRLRDFQVTRQRELDRQLAAVRQQGEVQLAAQQQSLGALAAQYRSDLDAARQQREQIQSDSAKKEADLRNQYAQRLQAAEAARAPVSEELDRLRAQREKEQLVLDQLLAGYTRVNAALQQQDLAGAQRGLDALRAYLDDASVVNLPTIQKRRLVEIFLIDSLYDLVRTRRSAAFADIASLAEAGAQLRSVADLVARGDALSKAGNLSGARDAYLQAMRVIPSVNRGYLALDEMRFAGDQQASQDAMAGLQKANLFYQAGNFQGSLSQYRQAVGLLLKNDTLANQLADNIMNAGYRVLAADDLAALVQLRTDAQKRQVVLKRIQEIRSQYQQYVTAATPAKDSNGEQALASLLEAKILLLQILDSEPVRTKYPDLRVRVEQYLTALERQGKAEGRTAEAKELASALGLDGAPQLASQDAVTAILDRLEELLSDK